MNHVGRILLTEEQILTRIKELGKQISKDYQGKRPVLVGLLTGAVPFLAELIKHIEVPLKMDFMSVKSYTGSSQSSKLAFIHDITTNVLDEDVILVDDIADSGHTMSAIIEQMKQKGARSVKVCCLLNKPAARKYPIPLDYVGFEIENVYILGFGLDHYGYYRNLPFIAVCKED
ncbi:MAG: hypoxanthine phosphoribosyltransferase [Bacillota bacterium]|nr:hypoxanthine phosphoribosyltransferase [Bacillota bacterium]